MVAKNSEWNIMLTFLQWSAAVSEGKVKHQKIRKCSMLHEPAENEK